MGDNFDDKLSLYLRSEKILLKLTLREKARQLSYYILAILTFLVALISLNIGLFYCLQNYLNPAQCAFSLASFNLIVSIVMVLIATKKKANPEMAELSEIRDFAKENVIKDLQKSKNEIVDASKNIKDIVSGKIFNIQSIIPILQKILNISHKE